MKRIVFLIIASLLVIGLVLPGCGDGNGNGNGVEPVGVNYTFEGNEIVVGIAGEVAHTTGMMQNIGASLAAGAINGAGGVVIGGVAHNITLQVIETKEATDESGALAKAAMLAAIDDVDFVMGGFRTEALEVYREVAMDHEKMFFNCGAATEALQYSCVTNYDKYKYWFKVTPYNEHHLASSVLRLIDFAAAQIRTELGLAADANLDACIVAEDLAWSRDEQVPIYVRELAGLNITNLKTYLVSSLDSTSTTGAIADMVTRGYDPHIIIPVYSGTMGVYFAGTLRSYIVGDALGAIPVGINVYAQFKAAWTGLDSESPGPNCALNLILDTWGEEVAMTDKTLPFLNAFMTYTGGGNPALGEYPLYTAVTYDALFVLKAMLEDVGTVVEGVAQANSEDIIAWYEDPANAQKTTTGEAVKYYPQAGTEVGGKPALSEAQVKALGYTYTYDAKDWTMPPCTTHDLVYGPSSATGMGCQWQWDETAGQWKKFGVWPQVGFGVTDQYGNWDFVYPGTKAFIMPPWVGSHFGS